MANYLYSAKNDAFFPTAFIDSYSEFDLSDAIEVDDSVYLEFINPPHGKVRSPGSDGLPEWVDIPPQTKKQAIEQAEYMVQTLMAEATVLMAPLQDADDIGEATDDELSKLKSWKKYRVMLNRIDTSLAPDIEWPQKPE